MTLRGGFVALALKLQESADQLTSSDVCARLRDTLGDKYRGSGVWAYYVDHVGDGESGDVIFSRDGDMQRAPYSIEGTTGAVKCSIDFDKAENVVPRTIYEVETDEQDAMAAMEAARKTEGLYTALPLYERFISKKERDEASADDFAGKGKSFPILKPEDVEAAARSLGRAGSENSSVSTIKARIIAIAKRKGWEKYLPKAWKETKSSEAAPNVARETSMQLVESAPEFLSAIQLQEATRTHYPVKLISPGTGSTAHYPAAVLERDGPKIFKRGTLMFWNHPTRAEEAARPEGDLNNLAAILTRDAFWDPNGTKGPGLYAEAKVMADYAQKIEERAPHIGLSIRAGGKGDGTTVNGKPVLASLDYAESVDYVTRAGRGGLALAEAARDAGILPDGESMDETQIKSLVESSIREAVKPYRDRALRGDAMVAASRILRDIELPALSKQRVTEATLNALPVNEAGELDEKKYSDLLMAEARREGEYLSGLMGGGRVLNMGQAVTTETAEQIAAREAATRVRSEAQEKDEVALFESLGMPKEAALFAVKGRAA